MRAISSIGELTIEDSMSEKSKIQRVLQNPAIKIFLAFFWIITIVTVEQLLLRMIPNGHNEILVMLFALLIAITAYCAYYIFVRVIEKREMIEFSTSGAARELLLGTLLGAALMSLVMACIWLFGGYKVGGSNDWKVIIPFLALGIISGVFEEILFRGVLFRIVEESLGTWLALLISASFFGFAHLANPNATLFSAIAIAFEAGVLLSAAYLMTRRLWLAIGIHAAWNFVQGGIFGVAVSGGASVGLLRGTTAGPVILTGGGFGAEASIIALIICTAAGLFLLYRSCKKGTFIQPYWKRADK
jgi:membrane protease YdiL (CAAX protease family)